jgi:peptidyl-tRNA hydrolase, PTH1 family
VAGLGNPGLQYRNTRHNLGWLVLEQAVRRWGGQFFEGALALESLHELSGIPVLLICPLAWMNQTGSIIRAVLDSRSLSSSDLIVVCDDLDLPLGVLRIKTRGGAGGHNGLRSVLANLGTDRFFRLKVGIGRPVCGGDLIDFVLSPFSHEEQSQVTSVLDRSVDALECLIINGAAEAMNRFHAPG